MKKNFFTLFFILFLGFVFRLWLADKGFHVDIYSQAGWGEWIEKNGPRGFYENTYWIYSWPTQPPLVNLVYAVAKKNYLWVLKILRWSAQLIVRYHLAPGYMVWWFKIVADFDRSFDREIYFPTNFLVSIKLFAIIADLAIAIVVFEYAKRAGRNKPWLWSAIYLFSPFSWYLSALWGQYDQISFLFLLLSFLLFQRGLFFSPFFFALSLSLKPTGLIFFPFYLFLYFKKVRNKPSALFGLSLAVVLIFWSIFLFSKDDPIIFFKNILVPKIFYKSEFRVSTNAFNFWHIFTLDKALNQETKFLFFPAKIWGILLFLIINGFSIFLIKKKDDLKRIVFTVFLIGGGGFLFLTNMLERYFFPGITSGFLLSVWKPKLLKYWLPLSFIFWVNLYRQWWFPKWLVWLKLILTAGKGEFGAVLSFLNVLFYLALIRSAAKEMV